MNSPLSVCLKSLAHGIPVDPLPPSQEINRTLPHAPKRRTKLSTAEFKSAVRNALRYFPKNSHSILAPEFADELRNEGHIYMRRFIPTSYLMKAYPIDCYPAKCQQAAAIMLMIMNNLDHEVAQYPHELITYGGNGSVFSNWAQYHLTMYYLSMMTEEQTLHMYSGHPAGLFPSSVDSPRVIISNGMVIPNYSKKDDYDKMYALGVSIYGQMTAGSYCYIGPQGIVHGTTITLLNAGRKYLGLESMSGTGTVYVSSGLGGMSGAQPKAGTISGAITVIAEVDINAINKRYEQGWVLEKFSDLDACIDRLKEAKRKKISTSIAYHGNIVDLWESLTTEKDNIVELGSDQTSLHNPFGGGYIPVGMTLDAARKMISDDPVGFKLEVCKSLCRQVEAINRLVERGMKFWDYGNSFLLQASKAGADVMSASGDSFQYPSYVEDIMGDIFSLGFGPFRWVCTSGSTKDLELTDSIAADVIRRLIKTAPDLLRAQYEDNLLWIENAGKNKLVVGSQARILYNGAEGRIETSIAFNRAVKDGRLKGPIVLSRDHHDVSGTDSPFRETSNIRDGSKFCADMAIQNVIGDAFRGATWVAIHNGGGVGWGEVINGGFGLLLDGSDDAERRARRMLFWDVNNGIARRAWAGNSNAIFQIRREMKNVTNLQVTIANPVEGLLIDNITDS
eukprot:214588_1